MRESIQPIFESILGPGHPSLARGGSIAHRDEYTFPRDRNNPSELNGGHFALGGLDNPDRYHSSEWDLIVVFEATNPRVREYDCRKIIGRGLRGKGIPHPHCRYPAGIITDDAYGAKFKGKSVRDVALEYGDEVFGRAMADPDGHPLFWNQARFECNPSDIEGESHWLWKAFKGGRLSRMKARHSDNPIITADALKRLDDLPITLRRGLRDGEWFASQGRVWSTYETSKHLVRGQFEQDIATGNRWVRVYDWGDAEGKVFPIVQVVAGFDFGTVSPSTLQVFAVTKDRIAFRVAEIYRVQNQATSEGTLNWFAEQVVALTRTHGLESVLCDPNAGGVVELFNLYTTRNNIGQVARPANNVRNTKDGIQGGLDLVKTMFARNRLFLMSECHIGPHDVALRRDGRPVGWEGELPHYVYARDKQDQEHILDYPDDKCIDHGCDAARYALIDIFANERVVKPKPSVRPMRDPWMPPTLSDLEDERREQEMAGRERSRNTLRGIRSRG